MRIRTQAIFGAIASVAAVGLAIVVLSALDRRTQAAIEQHDLSGQIVSNGVSGLPLIAIDYFRFRTPRLREQWQLRQATLGRLLADESMVGAAELALFASMRLRNANLSEAFARLVEMYDKLPEGEALPIRWHAQEDRLVTQVMLATQDIVTDAIQFEQRSTELLLEARRTEGYVALGLVLMLGALTLAYSVVAFRSVVVPIRRLAQGAQAVSAGRLGFRTRLSSDDEIGALSRSFDAMVDSLERTRQEVAIRTAQLEAVNHELESFSYSVSHDLRAPLRGIDGWSQALVEDFGSGLDPKAHEYLQRVRTEAQHMGRLIDDLLKLSRVNRASLEIVPVDLSTLARTVADRLSKAMPGRSIEFEIEPGLATRADARLLEIALTNLLENACKFTAPRAVGRIAVGSVLEVETGAEKPQSFFFVRDNGVGFDMANARDLFGAFQRLHRAEEFPGTGIGLATVKRIISRHGGRLLAEARVDEGATFKFTLGATP